MAKALGIDPGTGSFDLVLISEDKVVWEKSIPTIEIARSPKVLLDAIREAGEVDIIAGLSGYGTPIVCNKDIIDPETFALEILLLTNREDIEKGVKRGEIGIAVYKALADVVIELWKNNLPVCYIPSVILLPTVPPYRKINRIDLGTADKMAIAVLGVYDQSREYGICYGETSFILIEMGFGYNAVLAIDKGKIVDGYGGTLVPTGFLTIGSIDAEVVVAGKKWSRHDVFYGGVSTICRASTIEEALDKSLENEECYYALESMYESIVKSVASLYYTIGKPREILISGRLSRIKEVYEELKDRLSKLDVVIRRVKGLEGASFAKEAAQGYAIVGEGFIGGYFSKLINHMEIPKARGTVMDWIYHPRLSNAKQRLIKAYTKSIKANKLKHIL